MEAMRTHGLARSTVYSNLKKVVRGINSHPALAIQCDNSPAGLVERAAKFKCKNEAPLFEYCTGAIDGLAIYTMCPKGVLNQAEYFSGNKQRY